MINKIVSEIKEVIKKNKDNELYLEYDLTQIITDFANHYEE